MRRRSLPIVALCGLLVLGGCLGGPAATPTAEEESSPTASAARNPWGTEPVRVALSRDSPWLARAPLEDAIAYWNDNSARLASYDVAFVRVRSTEDADVVLQVADQLDDCPDRSSNATVYWCAPLIDPTDELANKTRIEVLSWHDNTGSRAFMIAALGRLLGVEEPSNLEAVPPPSALQVEDPWVVSPVTVGINNTANQSRDIAPLVADAVAYWANQLET